MIKLDYTLNTVEERQALVEEILRENPNPGEKYLEIIGDYLVFCMDKEEKRQKKILTENRLATINKREVSFEGLASQFENGEDGVYDLIVENNKSSIFRPKISITPEDLEKIPELIPIKEAIHYWEERLKTATGKEAFIIKKAIIDFRKDQYIIKDAFLKPVQISAAPHGKTPVSLDDKLRPLPNCGLEAEGVSLMRPQVCAAILHDYNNLKNTSENNFTSDLWALMSDFDELVEKTLHDEPILKRIIEYKVDGYQNQEIQKMLENEFQTTYSMEYISSLWCKKIPNMLASRAEDDYLDWYYLEVEKGQYKKCTRCGEIKLANTKYFSRNSGGKDGWYSICKSCRNRRK